MDADKTLLLSLYSHAIDEYRFEVQLNWDRTKYYLGLNMGIVAVAMGLLQVTGRPHTDILVTIILFIGMITSRIGIHSIQRGHEYYRRTVVRKTRLEKLLGLLPDKDKNTVLPQNHGLLTTRGMMEAEHILNDTDAYVHKGLSKGSVSQNLVTLLTLIMLIDLVGIFFLLSKYYVTSFSSL